VISLFSWHRAGEGDPLDDDQRFGWWGDTYPTVTADQIGSRLYLLRRRKLDAQAMQDARAYAQEALRWLTTDGYATEVSIEVSRRGTDGLAMRVVVFLSDDEVEDPLEFEFNNLGQMIDAL